MKFYYAARHAFWRDLCVIGAGKSTYRKLKSEIKNFDKIKEYGKIRQKNKEERIKENDEKTGINLRG